MRTLRSYCMILILCLAAAPALAADCQLAWDASAGATGYKVQISTDGGQTWGEIRDAGANTTYMWTGAPNTGLVLWRVAAYNSVGEAWQTKQGAWYNGSWLMPPPASGLGVK